MEQGFSMKPDSQKHSNFTRTRAFTVRELLVVILTLVLLAITVLPALFRSSDRVLRARCVSNLRQLGVALQTYANEASDFMPICKYRDSNPTQYTYEVARVVSGTSQVEMGYMNLGLLIRNRQISDPQALYCPAQRNQFFTYNYYAATTNGWFTTSGGDVLVRAGYNYFPQLRATHHLGNGLYLPRVTTASVALEFGSLGTSALQPMRFHELNLQKSIATDLVHGFNNVAHRDLGVVAGVNALFPDGRVTFQSARTNPDSFSPLLWIDIISDGIKFRQVMNGWKP
jgi:type II secretory pathway pseudopilin PulG